MHHYCAALPYGTGTEVCLHLEKVTPAGTALSSPTAPASRCKTGPCPQRLELCRKQGRLFIQGNCCPVVSLGHGPRHSKPSSNLSCNLCALQPGDSHKEVLHAWNSFPFKVQNKFCHGFLLPDMIFHGIVIVIQMAKISPVSGFRRNLLHSAASLQSCILILSPLQGLEVQEERTKKC